MSVDPEFADRVQSYFAARALRFETKPMMGGLVFMVNGKMCAGVETDRLMLRIDPEQVPSALAKKGCRPMDFTGRPMRGFVFVDRSVLGTDRALKEWLDLAVEFNPRAKRSKPAARKRK
jgi:TfoX/Sxy family transcriptional regulator of competence genes